MATLELLKSPGSTTKQFKIRKSIWEDFGKYERTLFLLTQLSYYPICASMLAVSFYEPSIEYCSTINSSNDTNDSDLKDDFYNKGEFYSLLASWDLHCKKSRVLVALSSAIMFGALFGSLLSGWAADKYGRRITIIACLAIVLLGNLAILSPISEMWESMILIAFCMGAPCGGYMVCNLTLLIEALELSSSRLIVVSLNGWSISMSLTAITAWATLEWQTYRMVVATATVISLISFIFLTVESSRWLASVNRSQEAKSTALWIAEKNGICDFPNICEAEWYQILQLSPPVKPADIVQPAENYELSNSDSNDDQFTSRSLKRYGYSELYRHSYILIPLLGLCYCFVSSSIVSFGFYFYLDFLPGNRYLNMTLMGLFKFLCGLIPFLLSKWAGRKPIAVISLTICVICGWSIVLSIILSSDRHWTVSALSLIVAASIDPVWKVQHLYSAELFPTAVRSMARGICNVGARLGSAVAPIIIQLRFTNTASPFILFAILLTVQVLVAIFILPETKNKPLPAELPERFKHVKNSNNNNNNNNTNDLSVQI